MAGYMVTHKMDDRSPERERHREKSTLTNEEDSRMAKKPLDRRSLLKLTSAGVVGATIATTSVSAGSSNLTMAYSGGGWTDTPVADGNIMTHVNIEVEFSEQITFGPDEDRGIRITNFDTGDKLQCTATETFTVPSDDRLEFSNLHYPDGTISDDPEFELNTSEIERYPVELEGNKSIFTDGPIFSTYTIEVIENLDEPSAIASTAEGIRAIGLERPPIEQDGLTGEIDLSLELPEALDSSWFVEFSPFRGDDGFEFEEVEIPNPGTDTLEWTADFSGSEPGSYDGWRINVYPDDEGGTPPIWGTSGLLLRDADFIEIGDDEQPSQPTLKLQPVDINNQTPEEPFTVNATVKETDDVAADGVEITLSIDPEDAAETVYDQLIDVGELSGGEETTVTFGEDGGTNEIVIDEGGTYAADVRVEAGNAETETRSATFTVEVDDPGGEPSVDDYTGDDESVDTDGLLNAIDDWRAGDIGTTLLLDVIDAWRSGDTVE